MACYIAFVSLVLTGAPVRAVLGPRLKSASGLLDRRVSLPAAARAAALPTVLVGTFVFAFWATVDLLGGYNGDRWSFAQHPYLQVVYDLAGLRYLGSWDVGSEAAFFFAVAVLGFVALRVNKGIGAALKGRDHPVRGPAVVAFELALWASAPDDMTWHEIDALRAGGPTTSAGGPSTEGAPGRSSSATGS